MLCASNCSDSFWDKVDTLVYIRHLQFSVWHVLWVAWHAIPRAPRWHANIGKLMTTRGVRRSGKLHADVSHGTARLGSVRLGAARFHFHEMTWSTLRGRDAIGRMSRSRGQGRAHARRPFVVPVTRESTGSRAPPRLSATVSRYHRRKRKKRKKKKREIGE